MVSIPMYARFLLLLVGAHAARTGVHQHVFEEPSEEPSLLQCDRLCERELNPIQSKCRYNKLEALAAFTMALFSDAQRSELWDLLTNKWDLLMDFCVEACIPDYNAKTCDAPQDDEADKEQRLHFADQKRILRWGNMVRLVDDEDMSNKAIVQGSTQNGKVAIKFTTSGDTVAVPVEQLEVVESPVKKLRRVVKVIQFANALKKMGEEAPTGVVEGEDADGNLVVSLEKSDKIVIPAKDTTEIEDANLENGATVRLVRTLERYGEEELDMDDDEETLPEMGTIQGQDEEGNIQVKVEGKEDLITVPVDEVTEENKFQQIKARTETKKTLIKEATTECRALPKKTVARSGCCLRACFNDMLSSFGSQVKASCIAQCDPRK